MRDFLKKILYRLPRFVRTLIVRIREIWWNIVTRSWEGRHYPQLPANSPSPRPIQNILIYHISGLAHAGTEKNLQLIANALAPTYQIYFMYGDKIVTSGRRESLDPRIHLIPFSYIHNEISIPHQLTGMHPHLREVIARHNIDLMVTASPGYAHYPWNVITEIPIVLLNIFGAPTLQRNIEAVIYNSQTTQDHAAVWIGKSTRDHILYAPLASLPPVHTRELGRKLRDKLHIPEDDFVFGRIGRDDDAIFDPIAIRAWQKIAENYPNAHYLIMSPPPILVDLVTNEAIPRVHFLPPSGAEEDVWSFHGALDAMAHFRHDGETSGVAIAESLMVGNPILTHRSHIWNAHLEYLNTTCAWVAEPDDSAGYSLHMRQCIERRMSDPDQWSGMQEAAKKTGVSKFSPQVYSDTIRDIIANI